VLEAALSWHDEVVHLNVERALRGFLDAPTAALKATFAKMISFLGEDPPNSAGLAALDFDVDAQALVVHASVGRTNTLRAAFLVRALTVVRLAGKVDRSYRSSLAVVEPHGEATPELRGDPFCDAWSLDALELVWNLAAETDAL
jgi:hypothetical protein